MPKTFSFDMPRLKLSSSRIDIRLPKDAAVRPRPSTPPPKSVRPPLSPAIHAELRMACTSVVRNNIPSHHRPELPEKPYISRRPVAQKRLDPAVLAAPPSDVGKRVPESDERTRVEALNSRPYTYKPGVASIDLFKQNGETRKLARGDRVDQLITSDDAETHAPSKPLDISSPPPYPQADTESRETLTSTPHTEATSDRWSEEKISTAVTSAAITPARSSERTSIQAAQCNSELPSLPKLEQGDAEWLRRTLERKRKVIDERFNSGSEHTLSDDDPIHLNTDSTLPLKSVDDAVSKPRTSESQVPASIVQPPRKEHSNASQIPVAGTRGASSINGLKAKDPIREEVPSRGRERSRVRSRARSISRGVQEYFRPGSSQASNVTTREQSRQSSRARSIGRQIKQYIRPDGPTVSRDPSVDAYTRGRKFSIDSRRSETSDGSRSLASAMNHRRTPSSFQYSQRERSDSDASAHDRADSPHRRAPSRAINLNRELPPLPGLDQWKDDEMEASEDCIRWHKKSELPAPRSMLILQEVTSSTSPTSHLHSASPSQSNTHRPYTSDSDVGPSFSERNLEMNRQRANGRFTASVRPPVVTSTPPPPPATTPTAHDEPTKRRWWRPQTHRGIH